MKTRFLTLSAILAVVCLSQLALINAEPISREDFMKTYQPILDRIYDESPFPQKQLKLGILMQDVICFDAYKVQILKLASFNQVSCVYPETAQKLVERGWGITHKKDPNFGQGGSECTNWWIIHHNTMPSMPKLLKTLRITTGEFSNEYVVWSPITLVQQKGNTTTLQSHGSFSLEQELAIKKSLSGVEGVLKVDFKPRACV